MRTGDWRRKRSWQSETIKSPAQTDKKKIWKKKKCVSPSVCESKSRSVCWPAKLSLEVCVNSFSFYRIYFFKKRLAIFYHLFPCFWCVCVYANQVFITITSSLSISFSRIPVIFLAVICFTRKIQKKKEKKRLNKFRLVISLSFGIFLFHVIFIFPQKNKVKKEKRVLMNPRKGCVYTTSALYFFLHLV